MTSCKNFPDEEKIYILDSNPETRTFGCKKSEDGKRYICEGSIDDGFWKLEDSGNDSCRWWRCNTPFKRNPDGSPVIDPSTGKVDNSDFSDCIVTNFPYYIIEQDDDTCSVHNLFTGDTPESACRTDLEGASQTCCTAGNICDSTDCLKYKALDKYLVSTALNYKCDGAYCVETEPGKGDFTNPYCDYQCVTLAYPKKYTCTHGFCQSVSDPTTYGKNITCENDEDCGKGNKCVSDEKGKHCEMTFYDNPYCDLICNPPDDVSFNCDKDTKICSTLQDDSGKYKNQSDCVSACATGLDEGDFGELPVDDQNQKIPIGNLILYAVIIIANIVIIYALVFLFNKAMKKPEQK